MRTLLAGLGVLVLVVLPDRLFRGDRARPPAVTHRCPMCCGALAAGSAGSCPHCVFPLAAAGELTR